MIKRFLFETFPQLSRTSEIKFIWKNLIVISKRFFEMFQIVSKCQSFYFWFKFEALKMLCSSINQNKMALVFFLIKNKIQNKIKMESINLKTNFCLTKHFFPIKKESWNRIQYKRNQVCLVSSRMAFQVAKTNLCLTV